MLSAGELAKLLACWKEQYGEEINDRKCVPIDSGDRQYMFKILIETLVVLKGYSEDDLDSGVLYRMIMEASVHPKSPKKKEWLAAATDDWTRSLAAKFPKQFVVPEEIDEPVKEKKPKKEKKATYTKEIVSESTELQNPIDRSLLPNTTPAYEFDEEFLKLLQKGEDE